MVLAKQNRIQFGTGDVNIMLSIAGTRAEPQAVVIFQSQEPTAIRGIAEDADLSQSGMGRYNQSEDIALFFSNPESIDCVISALRAIRDATFGEHNHVAAYLSE